MAVVLQVCDISLSFLEELLNDPVLFSGVGDAEVCPVVDPAHSVDSQSQQVLEDGDTVSNGLSACEKKEKAIKLKDEELCLECEWQDCHYHTCSLHQFVHHVSLHLPHVEVKLSKDEKGTAFAVLPRILLASNSTW
jgi:hypothetical protein